MKVLRSPSLAQGGEVHVVRLYELQPFARGGLAKSRKTREITLHISTPEMKRLRAKWGAPKRNSKARVDEYAFPRDSLRKIERFADGGGTGYFPVSQPLTAPPESYRERSSKPIEDYYTYGMGPEHQFYNQNVTPAQPIIAHTPTEPTPGPATQSSGHGGLNLGNIGGALAGGATLADALGYGGALSQTAGTLGNLATGNYVGAARQGAALYGSLFGNSLADYGSGAALNAALADAGITGTAGAAAADIAATNAALTGGAGAAGAGLAGGAEALAPVTTTVAPISTGAAGASTAGTGAAGAGAGAGAGLSGAAAGALGMGIVMAAAPYLHGGYGDELRNMNAFLEANPGIDMSRYQRSRGNMIGMVTLPDGTRLTSSEFEKLAGAWYGANQLPGKQGTEYWQNQLQELINQYQSGNSFYGQHQDYIQYGSGKKARGGALHTTRHVRGPGTGRSDSIPAQLSDGEYVLTAEDVSLLGDGSNEAGARRLDDFRKQLRTHKGSALSRGKISPNAKSPMEYMRGKR